MLNYVLAAVLTQAPVAAQLTVTPSRPLGTLREQAALQQQWLQYRVDSVLPRLMRQTGIEMSIVAQREYARGPVFWGLFAPTCVFARRRTIDVVTVRLG